MTSKIEAPLPHRLLALLVALVAGAAGVIAFICIIALGVAALSDLLYASVPPEPLTSDADRLSTTWAAARWWLIVCTAVAILAGMGARELVEPPARREDDAMHRTYGPSGRDGLFVLLGFIAILSITLAVWGTALSKYLEGAAYSLVSTLAVLATLLVINAERPRATQHRIFVAVMMLFPVALMLFCIFSMSS